MATIERKYALIKVKAGDYVLPANDGERLFRLCRSEGEGWDLYAFSDVADWSEFSLEEENWHQWDHMAQLLPTREAAIRLALTMSTKGVC